MKVYKWEIKIWENLDITGPQNNDVSLFPMIHTIPETMINHVKK